MILKGIKNGNFAFFLGFQASGTVCVNYHHRALLIYSFIHLFIYLLLRALFIYLFAYLVLKKMQGPKISKIDSNSSKRPSNPYQQVESGEKFKALRIWWLGAGLQE